jgi:hypothetical protein
VLIGSTRRCRSARFEAYRAVLAEAPDLIWSARAGLTALLAHPIAPTR